MSQIRSKQIRLDTQGDIIIADATASGSVLAKGSDRQVLIAGSTTTTYEYLNALRDSTGLTLFEVNDSASAINTFEVNGGLTGFGPEFASVGTDTNIDLLISPKGTGDVLVPVGYIPDTSLSLTTKEYVDSVATGLDFKDSVHFGTTVNLASTYDNGTLGLGATLTGTVAGIFPSVDSHYNSDLGTRILIKDQTDATQNGIYEITTRGAGEELTKIIVTGDTAGSLGGTYFTFNDQTTDFYVWFDNGADPAPGGTGIQVTILNGDSVGTVRAAIIAAINGSAANVNAVIDEIDIFYIINDSTGLSTDSTVGTSGFAVTTSINGTASTVSWVLTRTIDADNTPSNEVSGGMFMFVEDGATLENTGWVLSSPDGAATIGTDDLLFTLFSSAQSITVLAGDGINVTPSGSTFTVISDTDNATIRNVGGTGSQLAVFNGATNQVLISAGAATDAAWAYQSDLRDSAGLLILDGAEVASAVNNLLVTNAATGNGVSIASAGTDTDIDLIIDAKGTGRIVLDGTQWPDAGVAARSVLVANTIDNLSALTAPDGSGDQLLQFNDTTNLFEFIASSTLGGDRFADVALTGNTAGDVSISPNSAAGTLTLNGGAGIQLVGSDIADSVGIDIAINLLGAAGTLDLASDTIAVYDSTPGVHVQASISTVINQGVREAYDDTAAAGGANELFTGFFTNLPVSDDAVTVYFNGLALREGVSAGWTRSGQNLTLVDAVNGYSAEAGDIISSDYRH